MKQKIRIIPCILILVLMVGVTYVNADSFAGLEKEQCVTVSEYDILRELKSKSESELSDMGYSENDIRMINEISFNNLVDELKSSSNSELMQQGFTKNEIRVIREENDIPTILSETMGNVTYKASMLSFKYDSSKKITNLRARVTWEWSSAPLLQFVDIIATSTSTDFSKTTSGSSTASSTAVYYYKNGNKNSTMNSVSVPQHTKNSGRVAYSNIPMVKAYPSSTSDKDDRYIAMKGSLIVAWQISGNCHSVSISGKYGHATIVCTPSVGVSSQGGAISFTPSINIKSGVEDLITVTQ